MVQHWKEFHFLDIILKNSLKVGERRSGKIINFLKALLGRIIPRIMQLKIIIY